MSRAQRGGQPPGRWRGVIVFLVIAFGLSWTAQVLLAGAVEETAAGETGLSPAALLIAAALMFPPAIGAFVARRWVEGNFFGDAGLRWPSLRLGLVAWLGPAVLVLLVLVASLPIYPLEAEATEAPAELFLTVAIALTIGVAINSVFAFGEEFGWRAYLLPRLVRLLGFWPGLLLHGAVWGFWHAPLIFLIGYNYPNAPEWGVPMFVVFGMIAGVLFGWLQLASHSVLPPTIAHGAINAIGGLPIVVLADVDPAVAGVLHSPAGWVVMLVVIGLLVVTGTLRADPTQSDSRPDGGSHA